MVAKQFTKKAVTFILRYIIKDPLFIVYYGLAYFRKEYINEALFIRDEKIAKDISKGKSFIRIGDGEVGLLHGRDIGYQKADAELVEYLNKSIKEYDSRAPYILAIPIFVNHSNTDLVNRNVLRCWLPLKIEWRRIFNKKEKYADAHFFYYKNNFEKYLESYLKTKKLIINTTKENIKKQQVSIESIFNVEGWVEAQSPEPFDLFSQTKHQIDELIKNYGGDKKDIVLILSSGPMSKALAYEYSRKGVQALDIGKGFEHVYNNENFEHHI